MNPKAKNILRHTLTTLMLTVIYSVTYWLVSTIWELFDKELTAPSIKEVLIFGVFMAIFTSCLNIYREKKKVPSGSDSCNQDWFHAHGFHLPIRHAMSGLSAKVDQLSVLRQFSSALSRAMAEICCQVHFTLSRYIHQKRFKKEGRFLPFFHWILLAAAWGFTKVRTQFMPWGTSRL